MRKTALFFAVVITFFACQKDADEMALPEIAGIYQISTLHNMEGEILSFQSELANNLFMCQN